jgi:hypothetical protein
MTRDARGLHGNRDNFASATIGVNEAPELRANPALTRSRRILACARARARRWRRELGGGVRQHPGSNNCVEGVCGVLSLRHFRLAGWCSLSIGGW